MVRAVRGNGTLVPEEMRWITAVTAGRIEQRYLQPGAEIDSATVILRLSNPDVEVQLLQSQQQLSQAETQLINLRSQLQTQRLTQEGAVAQTRTQYLDARRVYDQNQRLFDRNPVFHKMRDHDLIVFKQRNTSPGGHICADSLIAICNKRFYTAMSALIVP